MNKIVLALALMPALAAAGDTDESWKLTGFYSLTGAKVLSGSAQGSSAPWQYQQWQCPCSMQNWEYVGVYEKSKGWQFDQESLFGLQLRKDFSPTLSAAAQLVVRALNPNRGSRPTLDWAYLSWQPEADSPWTFKAGRFRIPLYYYSDYLYIGYAYPWVRPAPDVYGWPIFEYNGANATYSGQVAGTEWAWSVQAWTGSYTQHDDAYYTRIYYTTPTHDAWKRIAGATLTLNNGVFDIRAMIMHHNETAWQDNPGAAPTYLVQDQSTRIMGLAANLDYQGWLVKSELDRFRQVDESKGLNGIYKYALLGVGHTFGNWTPMFTMSRYRTVAPPIEGRDTSYVSVRWDFRKDMALKAQYDISRDKSEYAYKFFGDSKVLSLSLQGVF
jgi:hypothetical protein